MQPGSNIRQVAIAIASGEFLPALDSRIGILISSHPTVDYTISFAGVAVLGQGVNIPHATQALQLLGSHWECLVKRSIQCIADTTPINLQIVELLRETRDVQNYVRRETDDPSMIEEGNQNTFPDFSALPPSRPLNPFPNADWVSINGG